MQNFVRTGSLNRVEDLDVPEDMDLIDSLSNMDHAQTQAYLSIQTNTPPL